MSLQLTAATTHRDRPAPMVLKTIGQPHRAGLQIAGWVCIYCGVAAIRGFWGDTLTAVAIGVLFLGAGSVLIYSGVWRLMRDRAFNRERARAREEWEDLRNGAAEARRQGTSLEQFLHERGYRFPGVIRWIEHDLAREAEAD